MIFAFKSYRAYLNAVLSKGSQFRRARLCEHLGCQASFLSQVMTGKVHLSLEYAIQTAEFLKHSNEELRFFLLLVQKEKAGSQKLENFFQMQIQEMLKAREPVQNLIGAKDRLSEKDKAVYYSQWYFVAAHILTAFPEYQTKVSLQEKLNLPEEMVNEILKFLLACGLVVTDQGRLKIGKARIHLGSKSLLVGRHHANWRVKAIETIEKSGSEAIHYSGFLGISRRGATELKKIIFEFLKASEKIVESTKEEAPYVLNLDFYEY